MVEMYGPQGSGGGRPKVPGMHRTVTVDVATLLSGELHVVFDEAETVMRPGDTLVQRGTAPAWSNWGHEPATLAVVMIDATDS
jgi:hypothetical protein